MPILCFYLMMLDGFLAKYCIYCSRFVVPCFTIPDLLFGITLFRVPPFRVLQQPNSLCHVYKYPMI